MIQLIPNSTNHQVRHRVSKCIYVQTTSNLIIANVKFNLPHLEHMKSYKKKDSKSMRAVAQISCG